MTWQQLAILIWLAFGVCFRVPEIIKDRNLSSGTAMLALMFLILPRTVIAIILSSAGFW